MSQSTKEPISRADALLINAPHEEARLLRRAAARGDSELTFHVAVEDTPFDFGRFTSPTADRQALISERQDGARSGLDAARQAVERHGGFVESETWLVSGLIVRAPGRAVPAILAESAVLTASADDTMSPLAVWDGRDVGWQTGLNEMYLAGYDGQYGGREMKIGILEAEQTSPFYWPNYLHCYHEGWEDWANGPSRVQLAKRCTTTTCASSNACTSSTANYHGSMVAAVAAASIEQGQDPSYPGSQTIPQQQRSGQAQEAYVYFWVAEHSAGCALFKGMEEALAEGVDVLNNSWGLQHRV